MDAAASDPVASAAGEELYRDGNTAYRAGRLDEARALYQKAWASKKSFDIAGNLGAVELELGRTRDAAEHLAYSLRIFPVNGSAEARERTRDLLEEAQRAVVSVELQVTQEGAEVSVDGAVVGATPLSDPLFLVPGRHRLGVRKAGREPWSLALSARAGESLHPVVYLPLERPASASVSVPPRPSKVSPWVWAGAGLGTVGAGLGVSLLIAAENASQDAMGLLREVQPTGLCPNPVAGAKCQQLKESWAEKDTLQNWGVALSVGGVAALAATAVVHFWPSQEVVPTRAHLQPWVAGEVQGLAVVGEL